jgi:hypothetical protein
MPLDSAVGSSHILLSCELDQGLIWTWNVLCDMCPEMGCRLILMIISVDREVAQRSQLPHELKGITGVRLERRSFRRYIDDSVRSLQHISHGDHILLVLYAL